MSKNKYAVGDKVWLMDLDEYAIVNAVITEVYPQYATYQAETDNAAYYQYSEDDLFDSEAEVKEAFLSGRWAAECIENGGEKGEKFLTELLKNN